MQENTCCFTGHRHLPANKIEKIVTSLGKSPKVILMDKNSPTTAILPLWGVDYLDNLEECGLKGLHIWHGHCVPPSVILSKAKNLSPNPPTNQSPRKRNLISHIGYR